MPVNKFTTGSDVALVIQTPTGKLDVQITDFKSKPEYTKLKSKTLSGVTRHGKIPDGHSGSFKLDRLSPTVDNYFAAEEAAYYAGIDQLAGTIYQTIQEVGGAISKWRYDGVIIALDEPGDFSGDKKTEQTISFMASKKIKVA